MMLFAFVMSILVYKIVIPHRGSIISFGVGFGVVIPLCLGYVPFYVLQLYDIQNLLIRFCIGAIFPVLTMFRTVEGLSYSRNMCFTFVSLIYNLHSI